MIDKQDLERLIHQDASESPILSLFLDLSVNSDNKRTHEVFLSQMETYLKETIDSRLRRSLEEAFARARSWLEGEFSEENRGAVLYIALDGSRFEALQFPIPVANQAVLNTRPAISPLAQVLTQYHHHGVILLDREHVRILSVYLGTLLDEITVRGEPFPTPSDVQAGGYSHKRFQRRKAEEMRHFFKEFAKEVETFVQRYHPDDLVILGTRENVAKFQEFLSDQVLHKVVYTGHAWVDDNTSDILARLTPHLEEHEAEERKETLERVRDRVAHEYHAVSGLSDTLEALQEGKVDTLVVARDQSASGSRCTQCNFVFGYEVESCTYCGTDLLEAVDAQEELVRMAADQGVQVTFAEPGDVSDLRGVAATLRY